jgi:steroid 5-alpha reductase family enzyme
MSLAELALNAAIALVSLAAVMSAGWTIQRQTGNSGWIDAVWTFGVGAAGVALALAPVGGGALWRRAIVAALAAAWSMRLGPHVVKRTMTSGDDLRYARLMAGPPGSSPFCRRRPPSALFLRSRSGLPRMRRALCGCKTSSARR